MYPYFCFFISILRWKRKTKYYSDIARWPDWGYARLKGWREKSKKRGSGGAFAEWTHDIKVLSLCYSLSSCVRSRGWINSYWKRVALGREWSSDFTREFPWRQKQSLLFCEVRHASHNYPCKKKFMYAWRAELWEWGTRKLARDQSSVRLPVVSYPWIFRTQTICTKAQTFRTHFRSVRTQPSGRFVPNKSWHEMFKTNINTYFIYPSNRKKANF